MNASASHHSAARVDFRLLAEELKARARSGTQTAVFAREAADEPALWSASGHRSWGELHAAANRLGSHLRALGVRAGDGVALMCRNRPEFVEVLLAALRIGARLTPISTQLTADEVAYIVGDCGAQVFFAEAGLAGEAVAAPRRILIGAESYAQALAAGAPGEIESPQAGRLMLYTSGTTGRPKGVFRRTPEIVEPQFAGSFADYQPGDVQLCAGPAYHSAPLLFDLRWPLASGVPVVLLEKWDSVELLRLIEQHRVTHLHLVPTMMQRLLALPERMRSSFDLRSLRLVVHGAAPCPLAVKRSMIEWLGPILIEYYAGTEGGDNIHVRSDDWLLRPGTVGRFNPEAGHRILDDRGRDVVPGEVGRIYFRAPAEGRFEYFGDPEKTAAAYQGDRYTLGDLGYVDDDGWLYLTGRSAETIISGGVNIYPREVDDVLALHEAVQQACTVGAPDEEWGERVISVVVLRAGVPVGDATTAALHAHAAKHLAAYKRPREIVVVDELPQTATGKLLRSQVRARFWAGRDQQI